MEFESYYTQSKFVHYMLLADKVMDLESMKQSAAHLVNPGQTGRRKRSRAEGENESHINAFKNLLKEWDHANLFPTFKVFVDKKFYVQLALNDHREAFRDVALATQEFRSLLAEADKALWHTDYTQVYNLVVGPMFDFLLNYQQLIIVWNLQCN